MDAYETSNWIGLFGAEVSASAALTGLIFVAASINLKAILEYPALPRRTLKALLMLVFVLLLSTIALVPGQPAAWLGIELAGLGAFVFFNGVSIDVSVWRITAPEYRNGVLNILLSLIGAAAGLATAIAGVSLIAHAGGGLYWLVPAVVLAFLSSLIDAWVLLIEIVR